MEDPDPDEVLGIILTFEPKHIPTESKRTISEIDGVTWDTDLPAGTAAVDVAETALDELSQVSGVASIAKEGTGRVGI